MCTPAFTAEQLSDIRRELLEGHAIKLAVTATSLSWIIASDAILAFWDDHPLSALQLHTLSTAFDQLIKHGFKFACLTPAKNSRRPFGTPTRKAA
ncbi:MAG: hypothetical protein WAW39_15965 [Prosthecobacter sp.]|uniref:hypothetical protein n=1 Tax=Prosthecobacter sp. TaxID=1965333 RepID=UPI003BAFA3DB